MDISTTPVLIVCKTLTNTPTQQSTIEADRQRSAVLLILQTYVWLTLLLPSRLVIGPIGAFGSPAAIVGLLAFILWATGFFNPSLLERRCRPLRVAFIGLWIPTLLSYAVMHLNGSAVDEVNSADRWLLFLLSWTGIGLLAAEALRTMSEAKRLLNTLLSAVAVVSLVGLLQAYLNVDLTLYLERLPLLTAIGDLGSDFVRSGIRRPAGTAGHPIEFGVILSLALGPALVVAFNDRSARRYLSWIVLFLIAVGIPLALSRSAIIGSAIAVLVWFWTATARDRLKGLTGALFLSVIVFLTSPGVIGTLVRSFTGAGADTSISTRVDDYATVAIFFRQSPLVGRGPATFLPKFRILDNQWLGTLIETGVLGVVGLALFLAVLGWIGTRIAHTGGPFLTTQLGYSLGGVALVTVAASAFYDFFAFPMMPSTLVVYFGVAGAMYQLQSENNEASPRGIPAPTPSHAQDPPV